MWVDISLKAILFALCVPGVIFTLPPRASLSEQAALHGIVFAFANYFLYWHVAPLFEGFQNPQVKQSSIPESGVQLPSTKADVPCPKNGVKCVSGDCELKGQIYGRCS